ncbi:SAM-dependent methyltransferase [Nocardia sp. alder85J]|uniref:SAM-dependent methyltransferase n=1 Tax=Nocardia sp. alder85J TaxID=2862949 RepID=UPI001CD6A35B|nr:SAM-dependent methyltransferase [Nocardia sp. alder85J]MCX4095923.1 SAM-dependent methyltransferase [Nocardia sp. alder85J]
MSSQSSATYPSAVPVGVDISRASIARVYDAFLGGKDNFEIDRQVFENVKKVAPGAAELALANRDFLIRVARFLAQKAGIRQYLDLGSGLPTAENTHQVVQRIAPAARVVYVDNDPMVLAHARALLEDNPDTSIVTADIFQPLEVLGDRIIRDELDFTAPIALFQIGTLHHYLGDDSAALMQTYIDALAPGSYVAICHFFDPEEPELTELAEQMEDKFIHSPMGSGRFRTFPEIEAMFGDLEMVPPGLVAADDWWPSGPHLAPLSPVRRCVVGGVGRKK